MKRVALLGGLLLGVAVLVLLAGTASGWWHEPPAVPEGSAGALVGEASVDPNPAFFGDPIETRLTVSYDAAAVSPGTIRVDASFAPYVETAAPTVTRTSVGRSGRVVYSYHLQCLTSDCLPLGASRTIRLGRALVTARGATGIVRDSVRWPPLVVSSRLTRAQATSPTPRFRFPQTPPAPTYSVPPGALDVGLTVAALALGAGAILLVASEIGRLRKRRAGQGRERSPRAVALAYVRESADRPDADRRKALELLAETLEHEGEARLAGSAVAAAWAEDPPTPAATLELADRVDRVDQEEQR
jgi:hypothetical protein